MPEKMSGGKEIANARSRNNGIKILNEQRLSTALPTSLATKSKSSSQSPTKQVNISITKRKSSTNSSATTSPTKQKKMDHYVLQTIKGEKTVGNVTDETIDFILADDDKEFQDIDGLGEPSGEIREELHFDDTDDVEGSEVKTEEIVEHVCGKCYKTFRRLNGLKKHLDFCRFDCGYHLRKAEMLKNLEKIEKDAVIMENKDICFCCGEGYDTFHLGHINCPDCPKSFKSQASYERHIFITHSENHDYPCSICNAMLRSNTLLNLHVEQHKSRGKPFACKICGKDFTRSYHLKRHQKYSSCSANENDAMNCKVCNRNFYRLDNLRAHLKQHLGKQSTKKPEYMCPTCKNCFYSLSTLNIHTRTHTGERPFECDLCVKKFPSLVALKKHRRYHTGEKPYTCSVCNQSFAVKEVLNRHMKRHTGDKRHVCGECGKSFIQATQLRTHAKTHYRPFACEECDEKFKTKKSLERHAKTHNKLRKSREKKARLFKCTKCKSSFSKADQLDEHLEKKHSKSVQRTDCAICDINFDTPENLRFHIIQKHDVDPNDFLNGKSVNKNENSISSKVYKMKGDANNEAIEIVASSSRPILNGTELHNDSGVVVQEIIVNELPTESVVGETGNDTILPDNGIYTIIPMESEDNNDIKILSASSSSSSKTERKIKMENENIKTTTMVIESTTTNLDDQNEKILLNNGVYTIIPLEADNNNSAESAVVPTITTKTTKSINATNTTTMKKKRTSQNDDKNEEKVGAVKKKTLRESLAAAIADNDKRIANEEETLSEDDNKLKENVTKLLDMMVDAQTLRKFGWPITPVEILLCKVIETCGYDISKDSENLKKSDYATRIREYAKLLFKVVIRNESIEELLNNYQIDEVISYVLCNGDEDEKKDDKVEMQNTN